MISAVVLILAVAIVVVGGVIELRDALRQRRASYTRDDALQGLRNEFRSTTLLISVALSAAAIALPALWHDTGIDRSEAMLMILALSMAAERSSFLVNAYSAARRTGSRRAGLVTAVAVSVIGGLAVSLSA